MTSHLGVRVVEDPSLSPGEWALVPPGRFVQELSPSQESMSLLMVRADQRPPPDYCQYFAFAKLNGRVRWVPDR